jgi:acyl-coenzyme A thioesterase PaaI-like protein
MRRGWFIRDASQKGLEKAAGRTADPSASLGMTRGEGWLRLELLVDAERTAPLGFCRGHKAFIVL